MSAKKITINDVADEAGISVTTVSLVLSGKGRISPATASRVHQAIEKRGFVRNRSEAILRGSDSGVIGLIVRDICHPFYAEMTAGLSETLEKHGKVLFLTQSGERGQNLSRCFDSMIAQGVDGIVLAGGAEHAEEIAAEARLTGKALVCASHAFVLDDYDSVRPDNHSAGKIATEYLIKRGHHCIAWLGGSGASLTRAERIGGYCSSLLQYGLPFRSEWIIECSSRQHHAVALTQQLIHQYPMITAILCHDAAIATGCYFGILRSGRSMGKEGVDSYIGQQMALVGFDATSLSQLTDPPLVSVISSAREIGRRAAMSLLNRMADPQGDIQHLIIPPALSEQGSA